MKAHFTCRHLWLSCYQAPLGAVYSRIWTSTVHIQSWHRVFPHKNCFLSYKWRSSNYRVFGIRCRLQVFKVYDLGGDYRKSRPEILSHLTADCRTSPYDPVVMTFRIYWLSSVPKFWWPSGAFRRKAGWWSDVATIYSVMLLLLTITCVR